MVFTYSLVNRSSSLETFSKTNSDISNVPLAMVLEPAPGPPNCILALGSQ